MTAAMTLDTPQFVSLEITGKCQLRCVHCYADSGPTGTTGTMATDDWLAVIHAAADTGAARVQMIGGEPTLHPDLTRLVRCALDLRLEVELYTNLVSVSPAVWALFERPGVKVATSYYSRAAAKHDAITGRRAHDRTLRNIREAIRRGVTLRVSVIEVDSEQDTMDAMNELREVGVENVGLDRLREIGRGVRRRGTDAGQLCGRCANRKLAVLPSGDVTPCLLARWVVLGNVRSTSLGVLYERSRDARAALVQATLASGGSQDGCNPDNDGGICAQPTCLPPHYAPY